MNKSKNNKRANLYQSGYKHRVDKNWLPTAIGMTLAVTICALILWVTTVISV